MRESPMAISRRAVLNGRMRFKAALLQELGTAKERRERKDETRPAGFCVPCVPSRL